MPPNMPGIMTGSGVPIQLMVSYIRRVAVMVTAPGIIIVRSKNEKIAFLPAHSILAKP